MNVMSDKRTEQLLELMKDKFPALQGGVITEYGSNYVKFDMGLIIQWGSANMDTDYSSTIRYAIVALPVSYTTTNYCVMVTRASGVADHLVSGAAISESEIRVSAETTTETLVRWLTIGF